MLSIYRYDTPVFLKQAGKTEELKIVMNKIYKDPLVADKRIEIMADNNGTMGNSLTYTQLFYGKRWRRASWVGVTLALFQQLTGINAIMFYSNMVFKGLEMTNTTITGLIGIVNFVTTLGGLALLTCFGRRTIMLVFNALMAITLIILAYYSFERNTIGMVVCVLVFIAFFEFSSGPIIWLYMAEIMADKAMGVATFLSWGGSLAISVSIPLLLRVTSIGYIFLAFGLFTVLGTVIIYFFMIETKDKSQAEIDKEFSDEVEDEADGADLMDKDD